MTSIQKEYGPFAKACISYCGRTHEVTCEASERIQMVRESTDDEWLLAVIKHPHTQKTVKQSAERRLRKLCPCYQPEK